MLNSKKEKRGFDYWLMSVLVVLLLVVVMIQVISRFIGSPITWGEEVAKWIMIWIVFGGLSFAAKDGGLISVDYFIKKFKPKNQKKIHLMNMACTVLYFMILFVSSVFYFILLTQKGRKFPITRMPSSFTVVSMLLGCILVVIFAINQIRTILKTEYSVKEDKK